MKEPFECPECQDEAVWLDDKQDVSIIKIGAMCASCYRDFGVIKYVKLADIDSYDEITELGTEAWKKVV